VVDSRPRGPMWFRASGVYNTVNGKMAGLWTRGPQSANRPNRQDMRFQNLATERRVH